MNKRLWPEFLKALHCNVVAATGCTEPISLAYASAQAVRALGMRPEKLVGRASPNLLKNAMGVTVPGTGMVGLPIAIALGAVGGNPDAGLNVLGTVTSEQVSEAKNMLAEKRVEVGLANRDDNLYAEVTASSGDHSARVCIAEHHTHIVLIEKNGRPVFEEKPGDRKEAAFSLQDAKLRDIYNFAVHAPLEELSFILEAEKLNQNLSREGLQSDYGMHIGRSLKKQMDKGLLSDDLMSEVIIRTSSASDARMGGATLPAMSNSGSGNQGIVATMPVVVVAERFKASEEQLARALALSHTTAIYIHQKFDPLSALCAAITAAMGAAAGMCWVMGGGYETCAGAVSNMVGDVSGMICDGASNSCAIKVSTAVSSACKAVLLALDDSAVSEHDGIVTNDVDSSIESLCALARGSMKGTDRQIIDIMVNKRQAGA